MRWWLPGVMLLGLTAASAGTLVGRAGPFEVEVAVNPDPPQIGDNRATITVSYRGERVTNATVAVTASAPGHTLTAEAAATGQPGVYEAPLTFPVAARYALQIRVTAGNSHGEARLAVTTGNPVWQAEPAAVRRFWLGLATLAVTLLIVAFLPLWPGHHDRKAILEAVILLVGCWLLARHAVQTWRKPGQMDVIEAQAMDMTAMKPPIGVVPVQVEEAGYDAFHATVTYTGSVVPYSEQAVRARVTGWIVSMPAYPGDSVRAGTVLAQLDRRELSAQARQAIAESQVSLDQAAAARSDAVREARRIHEVRAQAEAAAARVGEARSQRDEAQAALTRARRDRDRAAAATTEAERQIAAAEAAQRAAGALRSAAGQDVDLAGAEAEQAGAAVTQARQSAEAARRQVDAARREIEARQAAVQQAAAQASAAQQAAAQAEADVTAARADVEYWTPELARMKNLLAQGAVSQEEYDRERAQADTAAAALRRAEAAAQAARASIDAAGAARQQAEAAVGAATALLAARQAEAGAADGRVAEAEAAVKARRAQVGRQTSAAGGQAAAVDEAAETVAMRRAQLTRAQAELAAAEAAIGEAEQRLVAREAGIRQATAEATAARRAIPTAQAEAASAERRAGAAAREVVARSAAAEASQTVLGYTTIVAELDGVVTERPIAPPTLVQPGDTLLRVAAIDRVRLQANVAAEDARRIAVGAPVRVSSPKDPARHDTTRVTSVFPAADPQNRTAIVEAIIDNPDRFYLPGDPLTLQINAGDKAVVITVPRDAVVQRVAEPGAIDGTVRPVVWTVRGGGGGKVEYYCTMHPQIVQDEPGLCPICKMELTPRTVAGGGEEQVEYYCTMHPQIVQDHPGLCPICKMELTPRTLGGSGGEVAHEVPVTLGNTSANRVEVLSGLRPGDRVIVAGFTDLREGDRVQVVAPPGPVPALGAAVHTTDSEPPGGAAGAAGTGR